MFNLAYIKSGEIFTNVYRPKDDTTTYQENNYNITTTGTDLTQLNGIYAVPTKRGEDYIDYTLYLVVAHADYIGTQYSIVLDGTPRRSPLHSEAWKQGYKDNYYASEPTSARWNTKIPFPIFKTQADASDYVRNGDVSKALNKDEVMYGQIYFDFFVNGDNYPNVSASFTTEFEHDNCDLLFSFYFMLGDKMETAIAFKDVSVDTLVTTTFKSIVEKADLNLFKTILYNVTKPFTGGDIHIYGIRETKHGEGAVDYKGHYETLSENEVVIRWHTENEEESPYESDSYQNEDDKDENDTDEPDGISTVGLLTTSYKVTRAVLNNIGQKLWDSSFLDNLKLVNNNPIENIISVSLYPFDFTDDNATTSNIFIGNVDMGVTGSKLSGNIPIFESEAFKISTSGKIPLWANFEPYTRLSLFLPYVGFKEIPTNQFMGDSLRIKAIVDITVGTIKYILYNSKGKVCTFDGNIAIDIPITASNKAQQTFSYLQSAIGVGASVAAKDVGGIVSGISNVIANPFHSETKGGNSSTLDTYMGTSVILYRDRPVIQYPSTFANDKGLPCKLSLRLEQQSGYIQCDKSIHIKGIPCTVAEQEEIYSLLTSGVYL